METNSKLFPLQIVELEKEYLANKYLDERETYDLAQKLNLKVEQVNVWFKNRRKNKSDSENSNLVNLEIKVETDQFFNHVDVDYSDYQKQELLEKEYQANKYLDQNEISDLAQKFNMNESDVTKWFKNRRNPTFQSTSDHFEVKTEDLNLYKDTHQIDYSNFEKQEMLEKEYQANKYLEENEISDLANKLGMNDSEVTVWFKDRRTQKVSNNFDFSKAIEKTSPQKRKRKEYSELQKQEMLEEEYQMNKYLDENEISDLAKKLEMPESEVTMWFKNRRALPSDIDLENKNDSSSPKKRIRRDFSEFQKQELENEFETNKYVDQNDISNLAERLEIEESRVKQWFINRRNRQKMSENNGEYSPDKRKRKDFSDFQKQELEKEYESNKYLDQEETSELAKKLNLDESKITTWFKNRRNQIFSNDVTENNSDPDFKSPKIAGLTTKGGLISEIFTIWSSLREKVPNQNH